MLSKNQIIPLTITGEGNGVGRHDGMAVFVPYTAVGDVISCRIQKVEKRFAYGRMTALLSASADRTDACDCPVYEKCGGCVWRHISYEAELCYKTPSNASEGCRSRRRRSSARKLPRVTATRRNTPWRRQTERPSPGFMPRAATG